jgi:hypothetical protein
LISKSIDPLLLCVCLAASLTPALTSAAAADIATPVDTLADTPADTPTTATPRNAEPDSAQMEHDLQHLNWDQFRSVIEAVPKMKADVDAYGPLGWQYVKGNYMTYHWKKNIDKLDGEQKKRLAELIRMAR